MKFLVLSTLLCVLVATCSAQVTSKPLGVTRIKNTLAKMLELVKDISLANNAIINNPNDQTSFDLADTTLAALKALYPSLGSPNSDSLSLVKRSYLSSKVNEFKNAVDNWETALNDFPVEASKLTTSFDTIQSKFLSLGGVIVPL